MTNYLVTVSLIDPYRARSLPVDNDPTLGGKPGAVMNAFLEGMYENRAPHFAVEAPSAQIACEVVWTITNSYPSARDERGELHEEELHCPEKYRADVSAWRAGKNRSTMVGDLMHVRPADEPASQWQMFSVASAGFLKVA